MSENRKAVIHIINKFKVKNIYQAFRCIMIYQDLDTSFCFIKPLLYKIDIEIAMELFKIFTSFGPPSEVHVNSCTQDMVNNMEAHMAALCPMFNVNFIKKNADNNEIAMKAVTKLHKWMENTNKHQWEIGCCIVQREINTEVSLGSSRSPHERFFKEFGKPVAITEVKEYRNRSKEKQNQSTNVVQEPSMSEVTLEQNILNVTLGQSCPNVSSPLQEGSNSLLNSSLDTVRVKEEIIDYEEMTSIKDRMVVFDGGLILPGLKKETTHIEVKMERLDE